MNKYLKPFPWWKTAFGVQRYCKSKTVQNKSRFIFTVEMQRTLSKGTAYREKYQIKLT